LVTRRGLFFSSNFARPGRFRRRRAVVSLASARAAMGRAPTRQPLARRAGLRRPSAAGAHAAACLTSVSTAGRAVKPDVCRRS
jgi:hypothetical protein